MQGVMSVNKQDQYLDAKLLGQRDHIFFVTISLLIMLYGTNKYLDLLICITFGFALFAFSEKYFYLLFVVMIFFTRVLVFPDIFFLSESYGTLYRIYQVVFLFRFFANLTKKSVAFRPAIVLLLLFFLLYFVKDLIYAANIESVSVFLNFFIICVIQRYFTKDIKSFKIFAFSLGVFALLANFYGLTRGNMIASWVGTTQFYRFSGAYEPNFTAMYCNIGIMALICTKTPTNKVLRFFMISLLYIFLFTTTSITGILTNIIVLLIFGILLSKNKRGLRKVLISSLMIVFMLTTISVTIPKSINFFVERVQTKVHSFQSGNMNEFNSNRSKIAKDYLDFYSKQDLIGKFFGSNPILIESLVEKHHYSHNIYIDSVVRYGIIGSVFIFGYVFYRLLRSLYLFNLYRDEINLTNICHKAIILISGLSLSFMGDRLFLLFAFF